MTFPKINLARYRPFALLALGCLWVTPASSSDPSPSTPSEPATKHFWDKAFISDVRTKMMEDLLKMREFFDTTIPGTLKKHNLVFGFSPRAADVRKGEFVRLPASARYGLSNRWELDSGITPFCPNPINSGKDHRWGMGMASLGVRYNWGRWGSVFDEVTLGLAGRTPLGKPPVSIIDYYAHVVPSISTSRPLPFPHTTLFTSVSYDRAVDAPWRGENSVPEGILQTHTLTVTPSVLYKPGEFGAFIEHNWRCYRVDKMGTHYGYEFKAGPIWDVPLARSRSYGLPGKWQIEVAGRVTLEEGHQVSEGVSVRVRWRTTVKELFTKKSYQRVPMN